MGIIDRRYKERVGSWGEVLSRSSGAVRAFPREGTEPVARQEGMYLSGRFLPSDCQRRAVSIVIGSLYSLWGQGGVQATQEGNQAQSGPGVFGRGDVAGNS